jgi:alpha-galactosidase
VSVELESLPAEHDRVVRFWLGFMKDHADTLLHGVLTPSRPDARYTQVSATSAASTVVAAFSNPVVRLDGSDRLVLLVNGGSEPRLVVEGAGSGAVHLVVSDCSGTEVSRTTTTPPDGLWAVDVPVGGVARIERV